MTKRELAVAITLDVVTRFVSLKESTARRPILIKFSGQPASEVLSNLINRNILRRKKHNVPIMHEEYLPTAMAFAFCGNAQFRDEAKLALTAVLHALKGMFKREQNKGGFVFEDLESYIDDIYPNQLFEKETLELGLYLARDFSDVLSSMRLNQSDERKVEWFQVGESAINMPNPDDEWDNKIASVGLFDEADKKQLIREEDVTWERIETLGGGGQSDVYLVRSPVRVSERANCLQTTMRAITQGKGDELANAIWCYARPDFSSELGAKKVFKLRKDGPGLPKLLDSNEAEHWIVTEYFPRRTLEHNTSLYKGKPALALKAFLSLVNTVALLHEDDIVHRDIKPANVFVREDDELVLGDFGIVYLPDQPSRLTGTNESVGPHDYMPPWADTGARLENVPTNFDVYMLGKLLWCMVTGRLLLKREWFAEPENNISMMYRDDPHAYMINIILEKCIVDRADKCSSIRDIHAMVIAFLGVIEHKGQLLQAGVPRACPVCGIGNYVREILKKDIPVYQLRVWNSGGANDTSTIFVDLFICDACGHIEFFRAGPVSH